jgi:hypothetical protein
MTGVRNTTPGCSEEKYYTLCPSLGFPINKMLSPKFNILCSPCCCYCIYFGGRRAVLGFKLRASAALYHLSHFTNSVFVSAFRVAEITDMNHRYPALLLF